MITLADPALLALLLALPLLAYGSWRRRGAGRLPFPLAGTVAAEVTPSWRRRFALPLSRGLPWLAVSLLVVGLARPQRGSAVEEVSARGIDVQLLLDVSSSMNRQDLSPGTSRLEVATSVIDRFVRGRAEDRIGLMTFARFPRVISPLTLDHDALTELLARVRPVNPRREENTTAIGVALAAAVLRLEGEPERTRVVVLLTDGENRVPDIDPMEAADLARARGIRVYTIAASRRAGAWAKELSRIAERTGASGFIARDARALREIYEEIDRLERHEVRESRIVEWSDAYPWVLALALALLLLGRVLGDVWLRRLP